MSPPPSQAIPISSTWTSWYPSACSPTRRWRPPAGILPTGWDYAHLRATRMDLLYQAFLRFPGRRAQLPEELHLPWLEGLRQIRRPPRPVPDRLQPMAQGRRPGPPADGLPHLPSGHFLSAVVPSEGVRQPEGDPHHGDIPIYLSSHSAGVLFPPGAVPGGRSGPSDCGRLCRPTPSPPRGQFWGQSLYNWEGHKRQVFLFWKERIHWCARLYDAIRIDHFRAFHTYWSIPAGAKSAKEGHWEPGPGLELLRLLQTAAPKLELIAEDLGDLDQEALQFVRTCGHPGMKVMVFAFDPQGESAYLPHNCHPFSVVYTGTHDTPPSSSSSTRPGRRPVTPAVTSACGRREGLGWGVISGAWASGSYLAIASLQDVLGLGADARMNTPGTMGTTTGAGGSAARPSILTSPASFGRSPVPTAGVSDSIFQAKTCPVRPY